MSATGSTSSSPQRLTAVGSESGVVNVYDADALEVGGGGGQVFLLPLAARSTKKDFTRIIYFRFSAPPFPRSAHTTSCVQYTYAGLKEIRRFTTVQREFDPSPA